MLYNTTMQVPLIVSQPGRFAGGRREPAMVSLADLFAVRHRRRDLHAARRSTGVLVCEIDWRLRAMKDGMGWIEVQTDRAAVRKNLPFENWTEVLGSERLRKAK